MKVYCLFLQSARSTHGSDDHVKGGPVLSGRDKSSVLNYYYYPKYIDTQIKSFFILMDREKSLRKVT